MFDVKQLRVLKAVSDHGSFSAAADAMLEILDEVAARFELPSGAAIAA